MRRYRKSFFKWISISLLCLYFGFMVGKFKQDILHNSVQLLELDVASLSKENAGLTQKLTLLQADFVAEKQINASLFNENEELNEALNVSHNKLYFYERVVAPELAITGLNIYSFSVSKVSDENLWLYELVLMQAQKGRRLLKGKIDITFARADDSEAETKSIKLSQIDETFKTGFKFKYFQTLRGQFVLPEDVEFDQVFVVAEAAGTRWNRSQRVEKVYDWKEFMMTGESELKELEIQSD